MEPDSVPLLNEGTLQLSLHLQRPFSIQRLHPFPAKGPSGQGAFLAFIFFLVSLQLAGGIPFPNLRVIHTVPRVAPASS
jgi:hypothetical protein